MISFTRYVNITSGVVGNGAVKTRQLILRLFTDNALMPSNSFAEFANAADVGAYFGTTSTVYKRAAAYFSFLSKFSASPPLISIASWVQTAVPAKIFGASGNTANLAALNAITNGSLNLTLGALTHVLTALDFSGAGSLAAVATIVQTAIQTQADAEWASATVAYDATTARFVLTGGVAAPTAPVPVSVAAVTGGATDAGVSLGWESANTVYSYGSAAVSLTDTLAASISASNNFGSFAFDQTLDTAQITEVATWNATQNNMFIYCVPVTSATASAVSAALIGLQGCGLTLAPLTTEYPELLPAMVLATTDYTKRNATSNYMYQQGNFTPAVLTDADANTYDPLRVNYVGQTQSAGQAISFYQRGTLTGGTTSPTDMNVYANEMWLKSAVGASLLSLMLALQQISANAGGRSQVIAQLQSVIDTALVNGTISIGKTLNQTQIQAVTVITGDPNAWRQLQTIGYWLDVQFTSTVTSDSRVEYQAAYTLCYAKNDAIRAVNGTHNLV